MLAAAIMLWCALRGVVEGQVMQTTGVRNDPWFPVYHLLCIARDGALVAVVLAAYHFADVNKLVTAGALVIGWELFEAAYNYTRYRQFITGHENAMGLWSLDNGADVWLLHSFRILIGTGLILGGGLL